MTDNFCVYGLTTGIITAGDDITQAILTSAETACGIEDGDIIVIAESALASAEGAIVYLDDVTPSAEAERLAEEYRMDPRVVEVVIGQSDAIIGGIPGFLLCLRGGTLLPNAGTDGSNAPPGALVCLPDDPDQSAATIRERIRRETGRTVGVLIADSRTHAMRLGCGGVAIGCAGFGAVEDDVGRNDLFGRTLEVTKRAIGDNLASAAELVMGEADECVPAALIRGTNIPMTEERGVETIDAAECLFMGAALHADPSRLKGKPDTDTL
ncbi:F420-dependent oxidoreductase [Methanomicrobiaceae archaeon CYW5]|uniref:coenzyme F420-0:L-glutamate ligase n=1 Tax=Methanovulcanius yangii TaxID=1789227 RepID=UPI0029C9E5AB|nr:coenzyme F420-0:L-glutamate ligase [Methanovulcanius yangii]MBT8507511.1 F420-dependent oxidoreductase [Methanovulcanius yangii]